MKGYLRSLNFRAQEPFDQIGQQGQYDTKAHRHGKDSEHERGHDGTKPTGRLLRNDRHATAGTVAGLPGARMPASFMRLSNSALTAASIEFPDKVRVDKVRHIQHTTSALSANELTFNLAASALRSLLFTSLCVELL